MGLFVGTLLGRFSFSQKLGLIVQRQGKVNLDPCVQI
jgi:hypothetical protein